MNRHSIRRMICRVAAALLLWAAWQGCAVSSAKAVFLPENIERRMNDLQNAWNGRDPDKVIACFDGQVYRSYETVAKLMGVDPSETDLRFPFLCSVFPVREAQSFSDLPSVRLTPVNCEGTDTSAAVAVEINLLYADGTQERCSTSLEYDISGKDALLFMLPEYREPPVTADTGINLDDFFTAPAPAEEEEPTESTAGQPAEQPAEQPTGQPTEQPAVTGASAPEPTAAPAVATPAPATEAPGEEASEEEAGAADDSGEEDAGESENSAFESYLASTVIDNVNIRKEPDKRSDLVSRLELTGTPVTVIGEATDDDGLRWLHVELRNGKRGFVRDNLIGEYDPDFEAHQAEAEAAKAAGAEEAKEAEDGAGSAQAGPTLSPEQAQAAANGTQLGRTNIDKVNLRHKADKKSGRIMYITHRGTIVTILSQKKDSAGELWYKIRLEDKIEGYVLASTVDPVTAADAAPAPAGSFPFRAVTNVKKVNLRQRADTKARRVTYITNKGTEVTILEEVTGSDGKQWYKVRLEDKTEGYALSSCFDPKN